MRKLINLLFFLLIAVVTSAQSAEADSLKQVMKISQKTDTVYINSLKLLLGETMMKNPDTCLLYGREYLIIAKSLGDVHHELGAINFLGVANAVKGNAEKAIAFFMDGLRKAEEIKDEEKIVKFQMNLGGIYYYLGDYQLQNKYLRQALAINKTLGNKKVLADNYQAIGTALQNLTENMDGAAYPEKVKYFKNGLDTFLLALHIYEELKDENSIALCKMNIGINHMNLKQLEIAKNYLISSLSYFENTHNPKFLARNYISLAKVFFREGQLPEAEEYFLKSYELCVENDYQANKEKVLVNLMNLYAKKGEHDQYEKYSEAYFALEKALKEQGKQKAISELETKYEAEKKETANVLLLKEKEILQRQNFFMNLFGLLLLTLLGVSGFFYFKLKQQSKKLAELNQVKDKIFTILGHDLSAPAMAFRNLTKKISFLMKNEDPSRMIELAKDFEEKGTRLWETVQNVLNWAVSEKNNLFNHPEKLMVKSIVQECLAGFQLNLEEKNLEVEINIDEKDVVVFDKNAFEIINRNIIHNAIKFSPSNSIIKIEYDPSKKNIKYRDKGVGMKEETIAKINKLIPVKSRQGSNAERGTGIGLVTSIKLLRDNKGDIFFSKNREQGTEVKIQFA